MSEILGKVSLFDALNNHLVVHDGNLSLQLGNLVRMVDEQMDVEKGSYLEDNVEGAKERLDELMVLINRRVNDLPIMDEMMLRMCSCDWGTLYDVATCSLKNKLLKLQAQVKIIKGCRRSFLVNKLERIRDSFGGDSEQAAECVRDLNNFDDNELKLRASKYKEFLLINNEKPTRAFCLLGKENNLLDDMGQIKMTMELTLKEIRREGSM